MEGVFHLRCENFQQISIRRPLADPLGEFERAAAVRVPPVGLVAGRIQL